MTPGDALHIVTALTLYWIGLAGLLLPMWILKRWIFD